MNSRYEAITEAKKEKLIKEYVRELKEEFLVEELQNGYFKYNIILQEQCFSTYITDEELFKAAEYALDLLEEMKMINNNGINKKAFEKIIKDAEAETDSEVIRVLGVFGKISTEKIAELVAKVEILRRVGGAYAMIISRPVFTSALFSVYDAIVDRFDDEEWYSLSGYFLFRAILKINSSTIEE